MKLNQDQSPLVWGFTTFSETWNGRLAMIAFFVILLIESSTGKGILHFIGIQ